MTKNAKEDLVSQFVLSSSYTRVISTDSSDVHEDIKYNQAHKVVLATSWESKCPLKHAAFFNTLLHFAQGRGLSPVWVLQFPAQLNEFLHNCRPYLPTFTLGEHLSSKTACLRWCVFTLVAFVLTFLHCVFSNVNLNCSPERIYIHTPCIYS